ncbi:MAG: hypothetical protein JNM18_27350 [Planctomycetaceae bacterium]|nr:hypothetical protein [Planctomycetaceae bacterium]
MRGRGTQNRGLSPAVMLLVVLLVLVVGGVGTIGTLIATGVIDLNNLPWSVKVIEKDPNEGKIPVIVAGREIERYAKITSEHLTDPATNQYSVTHFDPKSIQPEWLRGYDQILGRVLKRDKTPGKVFTEADFYPVGTAAGPVAGIPAGMVGVTVDPKKIQGLEQLAIGDRFDILASVAHEATPAAGRVRPPEQNNRPQRGPVLPVSDSGTTIKVLVTSGVVVQVGKEAMVAVDPAESVALTRSLAAGLALFCTARSGQPGDTVDDELVPPEPPKPTNVVRIESIKNREFGEETFYIIPRPNQAPSSMAKQP